MRSSFLVLAACLVLAAPSAFAQSVGEPGNPEVANPAAEVAPSTKRTPEQMIEKSAHDAAAGHLGAAIKDDVTALHRGPLLMHGNYCGVGNRPGTPPIDLLDEACMHHDACTKTNTLPRCGCNERLEAEATAVAQDPRTPAELKVTAAAVAASMAVLICR